MSLQKYHLKCIMEVECETNFLLSGGPGWACQKSRRSFYRWLHLTAIRHTPGYTSCSESDTKEENIKIRNLFNIQEKSSFKTNFVLK
jgi:hypothetical protein